MWLSNFACIPRFNKGNSYSPSWSKAAEWENQSQYQEMFIYLAGLYLNLFKWNGLPDTCLERALERTLFYNGKALFFRDDDISDKGKFPTIDLQGEAHYWHTPVNLDVGLNIYYEHVWRTAYSYNFEKRFNMENSVVIRNNRQMFPGYPSVVIYTEKLVDIARQLDVTAENLKTPYIITSTDAGKTSVEQFMHKKRRNTDAFIATNGMNLDDIKVWPSNGNPTTLTTMTDYKHDIFNEFLTRLGIDNANTDKKERLLTSEVNANNGLIDSSVNILLQAREEACEEINRLFGLNVSVELRNKEEIEEVMDDGALYENDPRTTP